MPAALTLALAATGLLAASPGAAQAATGTAASDGPDAVTFTTAAPTDAVVGQTYTPSAVAPDGSAITYAAVGIAGDDHTCAVQADGTISLEGAGVCDVVARADSFITAQQAFVVRDPESCAEAKQDGDLAADGYLVLDFENVPTRVYCADTETDPTSYIDLPVTGTDSAGQHNYGQIVAGDNYRGSTVTTAYTKVRLDPATSILDTTDATFATSVGGPVYNTSWAASTHANWGIAASCGGGGASADLDLTGTSIAIPRPEAEFQISGWPYEQVSGTVVVSPQHVVSTGIDDQCGQGGPIVEGSMNPDDSGPATATAFAVAPAAPDGTAYAIRNLAGLTGAPATVHAGTTLDLAPVLAAGTTAPDGFALTASGSCTEADGVIATGSAGWCTVTGHLDATGDLGPSNYVQTTFPVVATTAISHFGPDSTEAVVGTSWTPTADTDGPSPVTFTAEPAGVCHLDGSAVEYDAPGTCHVTATEPGSTFHDAASQTVDITVLGTQPKGTVTFPSPPQVGQAVTPTLSGWDPDGTPAYSWTIDGVEVSTDATYTPAATDEGHTLALEVHTTRDGYLDSDSDQFSATVAPGHLDAGTVSISGTAQVGSTLTADVDGFDPAVTGLAYVWSRDNAPITVDGDGSTYLVTPADAGHTLTVTVVGHADGYADTVPVTSVATTAVANGTDLVTGAVTLHGATAAGRIKAGQRLTAQVTGWDPRATLAYQWTVAGKTVGTGTSLPISSAWAAERITLTVTASAPGEDPVSATAGPVLVVKNPRIAAHYPNVPASGWYRHPVTVTFTCAPGTAAVTACPAPVVLRNGVHRLSRTIRSEDGGTATAQLPIVKVDQTAPRISLRVPSGQSAYAGHASCSTHDTGSGHVTCALATRRATVANGWTVTYTATARDRAGNTAREVRHVSVDRLALNAPERAGVYQVRQHATYRVTVLSATQPRLQYAAPSPRVPHGGGVKFRADGTLGGLHRWVLNLTITSSTRYSRHWLIGATAGGHTYVTALQING